MGTHVDFYLLNQDNTQAVLMFACRLVEKAYQQGHQVLLIIFYFTLVLST